jgi:LCP family protein required for cell wall assembly
MSRNPSPLVAAALSLIFPGLGQVYAGAPRRGLIWALPTLALIAVVLLVVLLKVPLSGAIRAEATLAILALEVAFLFYHLAAMIDAYGIAQRERRSLGYATAGAAVAGLVALLIVAMLLHGYPIYQTAVIDGFLQLVAPGRPDVVPSASFSQEPIESIPVDVTDSPAPTSPGAEPTPTPSGGSTSTPGQATPTPPPASFPPLENPYGDRLNLLLVGTDAGPDRPGGRTDTMILLSVDIPTGKAAMFGFPRNMTSVPIEDPSGNQQFNRLWADPFPPGNGDPAASLITNMWQFAWDHPDKFYTPTEACQADDPNLNDCLANARAYRALSGAIQNLAGVPIHGVVSVNLTAFRELVDAVGGVWMDIPEPIYDDAYPVGKGDTESPKIINIPAGCHWFNGVYALAYARSRHQDSDYQRMRRQQAVLTAVRKQFDPISMLGRLDELLGVASNNLWTTIDRNDIPLMAQIAQRVNADRIYNVRITPGQGYPSNLTTDEIKSIRSRVQHIFEQPQPAPEPTPADPKDRCPAPGQTPGETYSTDPSPKP